MSGIKTINPPREWEILKYELFENKPSITPYPEDIVRRRELLLLAECFLADYQSAKSKKDRNFFGELYRITMDTYFV